MKLFLLILCFSVSLPVFSQYNRVVDGANLLSAAKKESLTQKADALAAAYNKERKFSVQQSRQNQTAIQ